ncbi:MAG: hypothetical protein IT430_12665 [Phycisphaerales bacterium]|nr:hypothetical protein [Phycisphaerales bacterium]
MRRREYVPQPTAAAIDTAMAKALSFESEPVPPTGSAGVRGRVADVVGEAGSFERGFVQTAGLIVGGLLLGRLVTDNTALLGAMVPLALLASFITHKAVRGLQPTKQWLGSRPRQIALGVACSPALTWLSRGSFSRSERATAWTAWAAALVGILALLAS